MITFSGSCPCSRFSSRRSNESANASGTTSEFHGTRSTRQSTPKAASEALTRVRGAPRASQSAKAIKRSGGKWREISAQEMRGVARGEEADLHHDHADRGDTDRDQGARSRIVLLPANRADRQEHERGEWHEPGRQRHVGEVLEAEPQRRPERIRPAQDTGVGTGERRDRRKGGHADSEHHPGRPERAQTRSLTRQCGVEQDRAGEHRHEHDRLCSRQYGDHDGGERDRLGAERGGGDRASDGEQCHRRHRVEEHFGHDEARIEKERRGDRECRGEQGVSGRHQPAREEEHRYRRERHDEGLQKLQGRIPACDAAECERQPGDHGVEGAVARPVPVQRR